MTTGVQSMTALPPFRALYIIQLSYLGLPMANGGTLPHKPFWNTKKSMELGGTRVPLALTYAFNLSSHPCEKSRGSLMSTFQRRPHIKKRCFLACTRASAAMKSPMRMMSQFTRHIERSLAILSACSNMSFSSGVP
jgi:hypothetical protein